MFAWVQGMMRDCLELCGDSGRMGAEEIPFKLQNVGFSLPPPGLVGKTT